ncbi:MAG: hypothetical protein HS117_24615 [Verrucomicrobiaceae bacterium]|nr:hypothetical protein [Verrucomicrobiaceae bacterium]
MKLFSVPLCWLFALMATCKAEPPKSPEEAIKAFRSEWEAVLSPKLRASSFHEHLKHQVYEEGRVGAVAESSEKVHTNITNSLSPKKMSLILYGKLADLKPDRKVWSVVNPGHSGSGFEALLDQKDGRVIFLWIMPEG